MIAWAVALALASLPSVGHGAEPALAELVDQANKSLRGDSSHGRLTMTITTPKWTRALEVEGWNLGRQYAFILIHNPPKEKGNATLRRKTEMWLWLSKVERVVKIPPTMMHSSWQGSDFTYEDIVKADSVAKDYDHTLIEKREEDAEVGKPAERLRRTVYKIEGTPKPNAPVVWGKVILWVAAYPTGDVIPLKEEDYSERGELIRTLTLSEIKRMSGKILPTRLECVPSRKKDQRTVIEYKFLEFDLPIDETFFSLSRLQRAKG